MKLYFEKPYMCVLMLLLVPDSMSRLCNVCLLNNVTTLGDVKPCALSSINGIDLTSPYFINVSNKQSSPETAFADIEE